MIIARPTPTPTSRRNLASHAWQSGSSTPLLLLDNFFLSFLCFYTSPRVRITFLHALTLPQRFTSMSLLSSLSSKQHHFPLKSKLRLELKFHLFCRSGLSQLHKRHKGRGTERTASLSADKPMMSVEQNMDIASLFPDEGRARVRYDFDGNSDDDMELYQSAWKYPRWTR